MDEPTETALHSVTGADAGVDDEKERWAEQMLTELARRMNIEGTAENE